MSYDSQTLVYLRSYFPVFELFCRLWLAVMSVVYGLLKLAVFGTEFKTGGFAVMSLLHVLGVCVMATQLIGGALLLLGYKSIWIPWALTVSLLSSIDFICSGLGWGFAGETCGIALPVVLFWVSASYTFLGTWYGSTLEIG